MRSRRRSNAGGTKVVLSIDSSEMPVSDATSSEPAGERDLYAEAAARLKRLEATEAEPEAAAAGARRGQRGGRSAQDRRTALRRAPPRERMRRSPHGQRRRCPRTRPRREPMSGTAAGHRAGRARQRQADLQDAGKGSAGARLKRPEAEPAPAAANDYAMPGIQLERQHRRRAPSPITATRRRPGAAAQRRASRMQAPAGRLAPQPEPKDQVDGVIASLNVKEQPAEIARGSGPAAAPPLPPKRPAGIRRRQDRGAERLDQHADLDPRHRAEIGPHRHIGAGPWP